MLNKKNIILHLLSLCVLCIGFVLCRYVFFDIHGIMGLPVWLFVVGMVSMAISFFLEGKTTPIFTALAYIIGFIAGIADLQLRHKARADRYQQHTGQSMKKDRFTRTCPSSYALLKFVF